ncbi:hypothetical protein GC173_16570 [bacterium]|nr:hypothetical protein [bacterium]
MTENSSEAFGLKVGDRGAHTSRTMMLAELSALFAAAPSSAGREDLRSLVVDQNVLGKRTGANRRIAFKRLSEMYGLDPKIPIYRILRALWADLPSHPTLALLSAAARDPLLHLTVPVIVNATHGLMITKQHFEATLREGVGERLNEAMIAKVARYTASSWTQSGHLTGRVKKTRSRAVATPHTVAFALLLSRIEGRHGAALFESDWIRLQDRSSQEVQLLAQRASSIGLIRYKAIGSIHEVHFDGLLTGEEEAKLP